MSVLILDSMNWMNGTTDVTRYYGSTGQSWQSQVTNAYVPGQYYINMDSGEDIVHDLGEDKNDGDIFYLGFFWKWNAAQWNGTGTAPLVHVTDNANFDHFNISIGRYGDILVRNNASTNIIVGRRLLPQTWFHIELKFAVSNSVGANDVVLRVDGEEIGTADAGSDTKYSTTAFRRIIIGDGTQTEDQHFQYFYLLDSSGSYANTFLGPTVRMETIYPNGNGNYAQFVGSDADSTDNYLLVDEVDPDDDTTYVESSGVGDRDSYLLTNITGVPVNSEIHAVQLLSRIKKVGASEPKQARQFVRISSTDYDQGSGIPLSDGTYSTFVNLMSENPSTVGQWTETEVNALEMGVKVDS